MFGEAAVRWVFEDRLGGCRGVGGRAAGVVLGCCSQGQEGEEEEGSPLSPRRDSPCGRSGCEASMRDA